MDGLDRGGFKANERGAWRGVAMAWRGRVSGHAPTHTHARAGARATPQGSGRDLTLDAFGPCFALGHNFEKVNLTKPGLMRIILNPCESSIKIGASSIGSTRHSAQYAAEAAPILGGPPIGQGRYLFVCCACSVSF